MKNKLYKIIMSVIMLVLIASIIYIFYGNKHKVNNSIDESINVAANNNLSEDNNSNNLVNDESIKYEDEDLDTPISLKEGIELLYNNVPSKRTYVFSSDINKHCRRVKNVYIEGEFDYLDRSCLYLKKVDAGEDVFYGVPIPLDGNYDKPLEKLRDGDKVKIIATIITGKDPLAFRTDYDVGYTEKEPEKFYVLNAAIDGPKDEILKMELEVNDNDSILIKYSDKEKIYDVNDIVKDFTYIDSENSYRAMNIFKDVKFNVDAKCVEYLEIYSRRDIKYEMKTSNIRLNKEKIKNSGALFVGKNNYVISTDSILRIFDKGKEKESLIEFDNEKRKGWQNITFKITYNQREAGHLPIFQIVDSNIKGVEENVNGPEILNAENEGKIVGKNVINLGDKVKFGNFECKTIKIDDENQNKALLLIMNSGVKEGFSHKKKDYWQKTDLRKYLNNEFIHEKFNIGERKRIFITENDNGVKIKNQEVKEKAVDKIFILSEDEIVENLLFVEDAISSHTVVRTQKTDLTRVSVFHPQYAKMDHDRFGETSNLSMKFDIYPCMWVNTSIDFEKDNDVYTSEEELYESNLAKDFEAPLVFERWDKADFEITNKRIIKEKSVGDKDIYIRNKIKIKSTIQFQKIVFGKRHNSKGNMQALYWDVVDVIGDNAYLIANQIIDVLNVDYKLSANENDVSYKDSNLKEYLEKDFYNYAFTDEEKNIINNLDLDYTGNAKVSLPDINFIKKYKIDMKLKEEGFKATTFAKEKYKFLSNDENDEITGFYLYDTCINQYHKDIYKRKEENSDYIFSVYENKLDNISKIKTLYSQYGIDNNGVIRDREVNYGEDLFYINELGIRPIICISVSKYNDMYDEKIKPIDKSVIDKKFSCGDILKIGNYDWEIVDFNSNYIARVKMKDIYDYGDVLKGELMPITWEVSKLRKYLNTDFYDNVFNDAEKNMIKTVENCNYRKDYIGNRYEYTLVSKTLDKIFVEGHDDLAVDDYYARGYMNGYYKEKIKPTMWIDLSLYKNE